MAVKGRVCVTGAGGYVASWVVKLLLSNNYIVHGTVRDLGAGKYSHLTKLEKASENLKLFKAELLDYDAFVDAIRGCDGVFHIASPVPATSVQNPEVELIEPAVKGTLNVLKACSELNVKRVVFVSSVAAIAMNPRWPMEQLVDETSWSDKEFCRNTKNFYSLSKTEAESEAWEFAKKSGLDLVTVCPSLVWGPLLQSTTNSSSLVLINILKEGFKEMANNIGWYVDVRDVADALLLAYEKHEAEGRYICSAHALYRQDLVEIVRKLYPSYNFPKRVFTILMLVSSTFKYMEYLEQLAQLLCILTMLVKMFPAVAIAIQHCRIMHCLVIKLCSLVDTLSIQSQHHLFKQFKLHILQAQLSFYIIICSLSVVNPLRFSKATRSR